MRTQIQLHGQPHFKKTELFIESMDTSFDFVGDDFPKQGPFNLETRAKLIHSVGSLMVSKYVPEKKFIYGSFSRVF